MPLITLLLNIDNKLKCQLKTLQSKDFFGSDIFKIIRGKNKMFPSYILIGQIAESKRGNKEYFNFGLMNLILILTEVSTGRKETPSQTL
jgi:hypothetical protein